MTTADDEVVLGPIMKDLHRKVEESLRKRLDLSNVDPLDVMLATSKVLADTMGALKQADEKIRQIMAEDSAQVGQDTGDGVFPFKLDGFELRSSVEEFERQPDEERSMPNYNAADDDDTNDETYDNEIEVPSFLAGIAMLALSVFDPSSSAKIAVPDDLREIIEDAPAVKKVFERMGAAEASPVG